MDPTNEQNPQPNQKGPRKGLILALVVTCVILIVVATVAITILVTGNKQGDRTSNSTQTNKDSNLNSSDDSTTDETKRMRTSIAQANASMVQKKAETYYALTSDYPKQISSFSEWEESKLYTDVTVDTVIPTKSTYGNVQYKYCSVGTAQVSYYDSLADTVVIRSLGTATAGISHAC